MNEHDLQTIMDEIKSVELRLGSQLETTAQTTVKSLLSLEERGTDPKDQKVIDLESRLGDSEKQTADLVEKIRLLEATPLNERTNKASEVDWNGTFIPKKLKDNYAQTRTLDTALLASGGQLPDDAASAFINSVADQQVLIRQVSRRVMRDTPTHIDELVTTPRSIIEATESTAPAVADSITTARRTLNSKEIILAEDISLDFLEQNIMLAGGEQAIMEIVTRQFANDIADLGINGRDATVHAFTGIIDGWIVQADGDGNVIDVDLSAIAAPTDPVKTLKAVLKAMPSGLKTLPGQTFVVNTNHAIEYADAVASRETTLGDTTLVNGLPALRYFGFPLIAEGYMSDTTASVLSDRQVILTPISNIVFGMARAVTVESQWNQRKRVMEYTLTAKVAYQHAMGRQYVKGHTLDAALRGA